MRPRFAAIAVLATLFGFASCVHAQRDGEKYDPAMTYGVSAAYANSSHRIFAAVSQGRKVFDASVTADWRVGRPRHFTYRWEVEVLPVFLARNPHQVVDFSSTVAGQPPVVSHFDGLIQSPCVSQSENVTVTSSTAPPTTIVYSSVCTQQFDYGGGVSPFGQRLNFRPGQRLQPFAQANAGFIAFKRAVPTSDAAKFNFTAELGGGLEYFRTARQSLAVEVVYHHLSNAGRGDANPSIENYLLKVSSRFSR